MAAPQLTVYSNGPLAIGGDQLNTFMQTCDSAAQMRTVIGVAGMSLWARGINALNDGLGGQFYWKSTATGPDDDVNTIVPFGAGVGAWIRGNSGATNQPSTGFFFQNQGAIIDRFNDRVFIGAATLQSGNQNGAGDYVTANIPEGPTTSTAQGACFSTVGGIGWMAATRTSDSSDLTAQDGLALMTVCINDNTKAPGVGQAGYFEAQQKSGAGITITVEMDVCNQTGVVTDINPYSSLASAATPYSYVLALGAGGERPNVLNNSAAMVLTADGAQHEKGIVFLNGAIGTTGEAISLSSGLTLQWWVSSTQKASFITGDPVSGNGYYGIIMNDAGINIGASPPTGNNCDGALIAKGVVNGVNNVTVVASGTGFAPTINATGTDPVVDLALLPKSTGSLILGGQPVNSATAGGAAALPTAPAGYLSAKLASGALIRLPYYSP